MIQQAQSKTDKQALNQKWLRAIMSAAIISLSCSSHSTMSQEKAESHYHIEVLVIHNTFQPSPDDDELSKRSWPTGKSFLPTKFATVENSNIDAHVNSMAQQHLPTPSALKLNNMQTRLTASGKYDVLLHTAWLQPLTHSRASSTPVVLSKPQVSTSFDELLGSLTVSKKGANLIVSPNFYWLKYDSQNNLSPIYAANQTSSNSVYNNSEETAENNNPNLLDTNNSNDKTIQEVISHSYEYAIDMSRTTYLDHPKMSLLVLVTPAE